MAGKARQAYADWQEADAAARVAERRLSAVWIAYDMGGSPPTAAMMDEVARLRAMADQRLTAVIRALNGEEADQNSRLA